MFSDERKTAILSLLNQNQRVTVAQVAESLDVSETTVRRDLQDLEMQGLLKRTHGGAVPVELATFEPSVQEKSLLFASEKSKIAATAVKFIQAGDTILLDAGTTTLEIAKQLPDVPLTVVTNSIEVSLELAKHKQASTVIVGGEFRNTTGALVGDFSTLMLSHLNVDKLFLGANGIHPTRGITTANSLEASTKKAMIASAREVYLVADHSKFGQVHMVQYCTLAECTCVISDDTLPSDYAHELLVHNVQSVIADA